jgi:hypothetical protein
MVLIAHRINTIAGLRELHPGYGVEIDVRHDGRTGRLYLNHDPGTGDDLEQYLSHFKHAFIIFNIKEAGTEQRCIDLARQYGIPRSKYFLLDVEFPFIYRAAGFNRKTDILAGKLLRDDFVHEIAVRYSEAEPIEQALALKGLVDWAWIDTNTRLPLDANVVKKLAGFKTCMVCPERWGRPQDIPAYAKQLQDLNFKLDAVMTNVKHLAQWEESGAVRA